MEERHFTNWSHTKNRMRRTEEYIEGDEDLNKDAMMGNQPDGSSKSNPPERCPHPLYSRDPPTQGHQEIPQEHQEMPQEDQDENLIKVEVKEDPAYLLVEESCKEEEEISPEISTDPGDTGDIWEDIKGQEEEEEHVEIKKEEVPMEISSGAPNNRTPTERCPHYLDSWDSKEEHHKILQDDQDESFIKVEVKGESEDLYVMSDDLCKEEEIPPEISTDGRYRRFRVEKRYGTSDGGTDDGDISAESALRNTITVSLHPAPLSSGLTKHGDRLPPPIVHHTNGRGSEGFSQGEFLPSHQRGPQKEKPFSCSECGKRFTLKQQLVRHQRTHSAEKPFSCPECGKCFPEKWMLAKHQTNHSGEKPFSCSECGRYFSTRRNLISHQLTHTGERPFSCSECGKCFSQKSTLTTHEKIHTGVKPYSCSECGKCFSHKSSLLGHEKVHTGEKPFSCTECGRCFSLKSNLITHEKVHTGVKPYSCSECGKCFTHKSSLVKHEKVHTGEKPFACAECGKGFSDRTHLIFHQRSHTGEKPFSCTECGKCFARKSVLNEHERVHRAEKSYL